MADIKKVSIEDLNKATAELVSKIDQTQYDNVYPIPKNGTIIALFCQLNGLTLPAVSEGEITERTLILDDLIDSGKTFNKFPGNDFACVYVKEYSPKPKYFVEEVGKKWVKFYFEETEHDIEDSVTRIIEYVGEDPNREGLQETPKRFMKALGKWTEGYGHSGAEIMTVFENESNGIDQIVGLSGIEFYSMCEHHLAPFFGKAHIYYIPDKKIVGISKLSRVLDIYARRFQNQERIAKQVADDLEQHLAPKGVAVILEAEHLCMKSRGVGKQCAIMRTSDLRGLFRDEQETRAELFNLIRMDSNSRNY